MLTTLTTTVLLVMISVLVHYEALLRLSNHILKMRIRHRLRILYSLVGALLAHVLEIWIFTFGYYFLEKFGQYGTLTGDIAGNFRDYAYYSFSTYTSLGFGDIVPTGPLRFLTGMETLTGLVLIAWTASFMFVQMQNFWDEQ